MFYRNFISAVEWDGKICWVTERYGFFMVLDLITNSVMYLTFDYKDFFPALYGNALLSAEGNTIYGICENGKYLAVYDLNEMKCETKEIGLQKFLAHDFAYAGISGDDIVLLLYQCPNPIRINKYTGEVNVDEYISGNVKDIYFTGHHLPDDSFFWTFSKDKEEIRRINTKTGDKKAYKCHGLSSMGDILYFQNHSEYINILDDVGNVYRWNKSESFCKMIFSSDETKFCFGNMVEKSGKLWLLPCFGNEILKINIERGRKEVYDKFPDGFLYFDYKDMSKYGRAIEINGMTYFSMHTGTHIFVVDENGEGSFLDVTWPDDVSEARQYMMHNRIVEEGTISLDSFLKAI